eukprot:scaffold6397_cov175-Ochromonas_danica.AAC.8
MQTVHILEKKVNDMLTCSCHQVMTLASDIPLHRTNCLEDSAAVQQQCDHIRPEALKAKKLLQISTQIPEIFMIGS